MREEIRCEYCGRFHWFAPPGKYEAYVLGFEDEVPSEEVLESSFRKFKVCGGRPRAAAERAAEECYGFSDTLVELRVMLKNVGTGEKHTVRVVSENVVVYRGEEL